MKVDFHISYGQDAEKLNIVDVYMRIICGQSSVV